MKIFLKRIYDQPMSSDGLRILVDRLWPRGLSKEKSAYDFWCPTISPSTALRKWFGHDPEKWDEFRFRYIKELEINEAGIEELKGQLSGRKKVTLLFAAQNLEFNHAVVLKEFLTKNQ